MTQVQMVEMLISPAKGMDLGKTGCNQAADPKTKIVSNSDSFGESFKRIRQHLSETKDLPSNNKKSSWKGSIAKSIPSTVKTENSQFNQDFTPMFQKDISVANQQSAAQGQLPNTPEDKSTLIVQKEMPQSSKAIQIPQNSPVVIADISCNKTPVENTDVKFTDSKAILPARNDNTAEAELNILVSLSEISALSDVNGAITALVDNEAASEINELLPKTEASNQVSNLNQVLELQIPFTTQQDSTINVPTQSDVVQQDQSNIESGTVVINQQLNKENNIVEVAEQQLNPIVKPELVKPAKQTSLTYEFQESVKLEPLLMDMDPAPGNLTANEAEEQLTQAKVAGDDKHYSNPGTISMIELPVSEPVKPKREQATANSKETVEFTRQDSQFEKPVQADYMDDGETAYTDSLETGQNLNQPASNNLMPESQPFREADVVSSDNLGVKTQAQTENSSVTQAAPVVNKELQNYIPNTDTGLYENALGQGEAVAFGESATNPVRNLLSFKPLGQFGIPAAENSSLKADQVSPESTDVKKLIAFESQRLKYQTPEQVLQLNSDNSVKTGSLEGNQTLLLFGKAAAVSEEIPTITTTNNNVSNNLAGQADDLPEKIPVDKSSTLDAGNGKLSSLVAVVESRNLSEDTETNLKSGETEMAKEIKNQTSAIAVESQDQTGVAEADEKTAEAALTKEVRNQIPAGEDESQDLSSNDTAASEKMLEPAKAKKSETKPTNPKISDGPVSQQENPASKNSMENSVSKNSTDFGKQTQFESQRMKSEETEPLEFNGEAESRAASTDNDNEQNIFAPGKAGWDSDKNQLTRMVNTATPPTPLDDPEKLYDQVVKKVEMMVKNNSSEMKIQLQPEFLGKMTIRIIVEEGLVTAKFITDSHQVKQMLESNLNSLRQTLESQGIRVEKTEVNVQLNNGGMYDGSGGGREESWQQHQFMTSQYQKNYPEQGYNLLPMNEELAIDNLHEQAYGIDYDGTMNFLV